MSEISDFGLILLVLAGGFALALVAIRITSRLPVPAPALFLLGAALLSDVVPDLREDVSIKTVERDHRGREVPVLRVKGSGSDLKSIRRRDFPGVRMDDVLALLERDDMGDQEMVDYLAHALMEPGGPRPSIETLLHGFVAAHAVVHTHADAIVSLTNNDRSRDVLADVYGKDVLALAYRRPGFRISREVAEAIARRPRAGALVLERHGTITWGATVRDAYEATMEALGSEQALARGLDPSGHLPLRKAKAMRRNAIFKGAWYEPERLVHVAQEQFGLPQLLPGYFADSAIRKPWVTVEPGEAVEPSL